MRDVNQPARARSHHRQRSASAVPDRRRAGDHPRDGRPRRARRAPSARACRAAATAAASPVASTPRRTPPIATRRATSAPIARTCPRSTQRRRRADVPQARGLAAPELAVYKAGQSSRRLVAVFVIAALLFLAVLARVTLLQTVQADELRTAGKSQRTTEQRLKAHRGTIFDRDGADLALSVPARTDHRQPQARARPRGHRSHADRVVAAARVQAAVADRGVHVEEELVRLRRSPDRRRSWPTRSSSMRLAGISTIKRGQAGPAQRRRRPQRHRSHRPRPRGHRRTGEGVQRHPQRYRRRAVAGTRPRVPIDRRVATRRSRRSPATTSCSPSTAACSTRSSRRCCSGSSALDAPWAAPRS